MKPEIFESLVDTLIKRGALPVNNATIVHERGKWMVKSEEGKNLGERDTKEEAVKRLRQVEYFKHHPKASSVEDMAKHISEQHQDQRITLSQILESLSTAGEAPDSELELSALADTLERQYGFEVLGTRSDWGPLMKQAQDVFTPPPVQAPATLAPGLPGGPGADKKENKPPETIAPGVKSKALEVTEEAAGPTAELTVLYTDITQATQQYDSIPAGPPIGQPAAPPAVPVPTVPTPPTTRSAIGDKPMKLSKDEVASKLTAHLSALTEAATSIESIIKMAANLKKGAPLIAQASVDDLKQVWSRLKANATRIDTLLADLKIKRLGQELNADVTEALTDVSTTLEDAQGALQHAQAELVPNLPKTSEKDDKEEKKDKDDKDEKKEGSVMDAFHLVRAAAQELAKLVPELHAIGTAVPPTGAEDTGDKTLAKNPAQVELTAWHQGQSAFDTAKGKEDRLRSDPSEGMLKSLVADLLDGSNPKSARWVASAFEAPVLTLSYQAALNGAPHTQARFAAFTSEDYGKQFLRVLSANGVRKIAVKYGLAKVGAEDVPPEKPKKEPEGKKPTPPQKPEETPPSEEPQGTENFADFKSWAVETFAENEDDQRKLEGAKDLVDILQEVADTPDDQLQVMMMYTEALEPAEEENRPGEFGEGAPGGAGEVPPERPVEGPPVRPQGYGMAVGSRQRRAVSQPEYNEGGHKGEMLPEDGGEGSDQAYYSKAYGDASYARELVAAGFHPALVKRAQELAEAEIRQGLVSEANFVAEVQDILTWAPETYQKVASRVFSATVEEPQQSGIVHDRLTGVRGAAKSLNVADLPSDVKGPAKIQRGAGFVPQLRKTASTAAPGAELIPDLQAHFTTTENKLRAKGMDPALFRPTHRYGENR